MYRCLTIYGRTQNGRIFQPEMNGKVINSHWTDLLLKRFKDIDGVYSAWLCDGTKGICVTKKYKDVDNNILAEIMDFVKQHNLKFEAKENISNWVKKYETE